MFEEYKSRHPKLSEYFERFADSYKRIEVPAKTILLREGEVSRRSFFVEKGCLRASFNNNGKDVTFQFFFEGDNVSSAESFKKEVPSIFGIESIEPSVLQVMAKQDYLEIMKELSTSAQFMNELVDILFERQLHYMKEFLSFIRDTPADRYATLIRERPHIVHRIPQHYIASYLGITAVSLSRIRSKMNR